MYTIKSLCNTGPPHNIFIFCFCPATDRIVDKIAFQTIFVPSWKIKITGKLDDIEIFYH